MTKNLIILVGCLVFFSMAGMANALPIINGGFESGDTTGWAVDSYYGYPRVLTIDYPYDRNELFNDYPDDRVEIFNSTDGDYFASLGATVQISQDITWGVGDNLSFDFAFISHDIYFVRSVANTVFEVKDGEIREFPGNFDYYLEKSKESRAPVRKQKIKTEQVDLKKAEAKKKEKEKERLRKEGKKERKALNASLGNKIDRLQRKKEALLLESDTKKRAISRPHKYRDEEVIKEYELRINQIVKEIEDLDEEIKNLKKQLIR